jgi:hypothetical protein
MVVWQSCEERRQATWALPSVRRTAVQRTEVLGGRSRWQLSRRARLALVYSLAMASALASSYLILALKL